LSLFRLEMMVKLFIKEWGDELIGCISILVAGTNSSEPKS